MRLFANYILATMSVLMTACGTPSTVEESLAAPPSVPASDRGKLDTRAPLWLEEQNVPSMAVALIGDNGVEWTAVYGEQEPGKKATDDTLYNIASLTKPITAETILALVGEGRLTLDTPIADIFMDAELAGDLRAGQLTLRHLLSHRSGFSKNWRRLMPGGKLRIAWEPGTKAAYSGENYELARKYVAAFTGNTLDELARERLFVPAGISDIWFSPDSSWTGRVAMVRGEDGTLRLPDTSADASGADNIHATIGDYARFVSYAMNGSRLSPALQQARGTIYDDQASQACPEGIIPPELCPRAAGFGLGWQIYDSGENRFLIHSGKDWGERTIALFEPQKKFGVVIFTAGANGRQIISDTLKLLIPDAKLNALVAAEARFEQMQREPAPPSD